MTLTFYITSGNKVKKFTSAVLLDEYVKKFKLSSSARIDMKDESGNVLGSMLVSTYLQKSE